MLGNFVQLMLQGVRDPVAHNMFNGGGGAPAPDPNMGKAAQRQADVAEREAKIAEDQLAWSKEHGNKLLALQNRVADIQLPIAQQNAAQAKADRDRYNSTYVPLEQDYANKAATYNSQGEQDRAAGQASADVQQSIDTQQQDNARRLAQYGIAPDSGRYAALNEAINVQGGAAKAGAANQARIQARDIGMGYEGNAISMGSGIANRAIGLDANAVNAGNSVVGGAASALNSASQATTAPAAYFQGANTGYQNAGNIYAAQYNAAMQGYNAKQASTGALYGAIGTVAGVALAPYTGGASLALAGAGAAAASGAGSGGGGGGYDYSTTSQGAHAYDTGTGAYAGYGGGTGGGGYGGGSGSPYTANAGSGNSAVYFKDGGAVTGPGTDTSDSVPANLSRDEFVMNAAAVKHFGLKKMQDMNRAGLEARYGMKFKGGA